MKHYRQGDVLIARINSIPESATPKAGPVILAYGEVTGHCHQIHEGAALFEDSGVTYLEVQQALADLRHEEHSTIPIERGVYRVTIQREYTPQGIRNVQD